MGAYYIYLGDTVAMFDFDISKLAVIGTVSLVVLGPERLPRVAHTLGAMLGHAQRYLANVRAEVDQQIQAGDLRALKDDIEQAMIQLQGTVDQGVREHMNEMQVEVDAVTAGLMAALPDNYLPSIHEMPGEAHDELFEVRPAYASALAQESRSTSSVPPSNGVSTRTPIVQRKRQIWHSPTQTGRRSVRRSRVVSIAASKALGRETGRIA
jgi:sec-independent protein translocase protein TatB